jgi:hypothetical protein
MAMIGFEDQFIIDDPPDHPAMYEPDVEVAIQLGTAIVKFIVVLLLII